MGHTLRVVLDTNVLLSGIAFPGSIPGKIMAAWRHGSVEVVLSQFILDELRRVLPRLSARHGLNAWEIDDLVDTLSIQAELIDPLPVLGTLLGAVQMGDIDYLITGDKDLLVLADCYPIISPAVFWEKHGGL